MKKIAKVAALLLLLLFALGWSTWTSQREAMTMEIKMDLDPFRSVQSGVQGVVKSAGSQVENLKGVASSFIPFKDTLRGLHRKWRRRNMLS